MVLFTVPDFIPEFQGISKVPAYMDNKFFNSILHDWFNFPVLSQDFFIFLFFNFLFLGTMKGLKIMLCYV